MSRGVLYMAAGDAYLAEVERSAASVRGQMPDTDIAIAAPPDADVPGVFDRHLAREFDTATDDSGRTWLLNSTIPPDLSPFEKTLYLDSDTHLCADVSELWGLLERVDLAAAATPSRAPVAGVPEPWCLMNCGVIAYRDRAATRTLLERWRDGYRAALDAQGRPVDQPAFARALYGTDIRWHELPRRYNVRVPRKGVLTARAKIIHGRHPAATLAEIAAELNATARPRVYRERSYLSTPTHTLVANGTYRYHVERTLAEHGLAATLKRALGCLGRRVSNREVFERWVRPPHHNRPEPGADRRGG